ncbi:MAG: beta-glycosidase [Tannerellaceae bacterium]|jgi:glucosylceramidase|nr:beta-glycosidase [Tannerellaceae bacterium]
MKVNNPVFVLLFTALLATACSEAPTLTAFVSSTQEAYWKVQPLPPSAKAGEMADVVIRSGDTLQTIEGFGACFNELGWTSLNMLEEETRREILRELFVPGLGANFTICRMPIGANDFALDWYSYNETEGDFAMKDFSIDNDRKTLIPFIRSALEYRPDLRVWASPWSPPSWMKHNKHYSARQGKEGTDMFILEEDYLKAYALYFTRFIEAYRAEGIRIFAVMPQNEFNSAQIFPSCCWTAAGLADFVGNYLGPALTEIDVEVMFGTMERPNERLVDTLLTHPAAGKYIRGVGFQWAGKEAIEGIHARYPHLRLYQTEQECGNGENTWEGAMYAWELMKHYFSKGASAYLYWNISLEKGGVSRWGWAQNSLVVVDRDRTFAYTPEYYVLKHLSRYVLPGARRLQTQGDYDDLLAFANPDGSIVVAIGNQEDSERSVCIQVDNASFTPLLPAHSIHTLLIQKP